MRRPSSNGKTHCELGTSNRVFRVMMSDHVVAAPMTRVVARLQLLAPSIQIDILPLADTPEEQLERGDCLFCADKDGVWPIGVCWVAAG